MNNNLILDISYLIASATFILGLKMLSKPDSARKGNLVAAAGMFIGILATIFLYEKEDGTHLGNYIWIFSALLVGTVGGTLMAKRVKMTAMPQMVSLFNGMGGACAAVISFVEIKHSFHTHPEATDASAIGFIIITLLGLLIGSVSFAGSMIAYGKLEEKIKDKVLPAQQIINLLMMLGIFSMIGLILFTEGNDMMYVYGIAGISLLYGVLFVLPIGGADMPVVISLLNSFTGMAAAFGGFVYGNNAMLTGGILVGSAGTILTVLMCKAMNRSLVNVIVGSFGGGGGAAKKEGGPAGEIREISATDLAVLCKYASKVKIIPGYGLAVAQAQHLCHEFEKLLEAEGVDVKFAIHPVAGRMPGHMNVLLAEADVPYDKLVEMEEVNDDFKNTDVSIVIGANDVVNPAAKNDPSSPIYGMPILEVEDSQNIVIMKRSMGKGYAGIENELFFNPKARMLFGDAKASLEKLNKEIKSL